MPFPRICENWQRNEERTEKNKGQRLSSLFIFINSKSYRRPPLCIVPSLIRRPVHRTHKSQNETKTKCNGDLATFTWIVVFAFGMTYATKRHCNRMCPISFVNTNECWWQQFIDNLQNQFFNPNFHQKSTFTSNREREREEIRIHVRRTDEYHSR